MRKLTKLHNKMSLETGETKQRAKLVKSKHGWLKVAMGTMVASAALFAFNVSGSASADEVTTTPQTEQTTITDKTTQDQNNDQSNDASKTDETHDQSQAPAATTPAVDTNATPEQPAEAPKLVGTRNNATRFTTQLSSGEYTTTDFQNIRDAASINGKVIDTVNGGQTIRYDNKRASDGYTWLHYNQNGQDRWIADLATQNTSNGLASALPGAQYGVDVASYQDTDLSKYAQNGAKYAIVKVSEGTGYVNPNAAGQISSAKDNGMAVMGYGYTHFGADQNAAINESNYLIQQAKAAGMPDGSYLACDYEVNASSDVQQNTTAVLAYMNNIQNNGYKALIYSGSNYFNANLDNQRIVDAHPNSLWIASYTGSGRDSSVMIPKQNGVLIWQYTDNKDGIGVDGNISLMDLNNNTSTPSAQPTPAPAPVQTNGQSGSYTLSGAQNVRTDASLNAGITGQAPAGYTINYDGIRNNDGYNWLHYTNFNGQDRWIADMNGTTGQAAASQKPAPAPQPATPAPAPGQTNGQSGSYTLSGAQNVRTDASLSADVTGQAPAGYTINYDGTRNNDGYNWLHYTNFNGQDRWIADMNGTTGQATASQTPAPAPQPAAAPSQNNNGGVYTLDQRQNVRNGANLSAGITGQLDAGYSVRYDGFTNADGYNWLHYQNINGQDRWVADMNGTTGQAAENQTSAPDPQPEPTTPSNNDGVTSVNGTYTLSGEQNVRTDASVNAQVTGQLQAGYTVNFNGAKDADGFTWLRYENFNGQDRWVAKLQDAAQNNNPNIPNVSGLGGAVVAEAQSHIGGAYAWGGTSPAGFDCSGLVQYVYGVSGVNLPRTTDGQYSVSRHISEAEAQPGDIVFISNGSGIYHDGIYIGNGRMIDAQTPENGVAIGQYGYYGGAVSFGRVY